MTAGGARTVLGNMPGLTAEHAEIVLEATTALFISELSVLAEFRGQVGRRGSLLLELTRSFGRLPGGIDRKSVV